MPATVAASDTSDSQLAKAFMDLAPMVMFLVGAGGVITWVGGALFELFGYRPDEVLGANVLEYVDTTWNPIAIDSIGAAMSREGLQRAMLFRLIRKDGSTFVAEVQANSQWENPIIEGMAVYLRRWDEQMLLNEVIEHVASGSPMDETLTLLSRIMSAETLDGKGVILLDPVGGRFHRGLVGNDLPVELSDDVDREGTPWQLAITSKLPVAIRVEECTEPTRTLAAAEGFKWCWTWPVLQEGEVTACLVLWRTMDEPPDHTCTMLLDNLCRITGLVLDRQHQVERLFHAATHDTLTDLPNRAHFFDHLQNALDLVNGPRVGVLYVDLDRFKPVNDQFGHGVGDQVLRTVARRLEASVREEDVVSRLGGDEFAVLCREDSETTALEVTLEAMASRIASSLVDPMQVGDVQVFIGASVGIAHASPGSCSMDVLIEAADAALYAAKKDGRGGWRVKLPA